MITKEEIIALNEYFYSVMVPSELANFVKKLELIEKEIHVKEEMQEKLKEIHDELLQLTDDKKEE